VLNPTGSVDSLNKSVALIQVNGRSVRTKSINDGKLVLRARNQASLMACFLALSEGRDDIGLLLLLLLLLLHALCLKQQETLMDVAAPQYETVRIVASSQKVFKKRKRTFTI
jgi:hypothetical protein